MEKNANCHGTEFPQELLISFAKAMAPEIKMFYQSDAGKTYCPVKKGGTYVLPSNSIF